MPVTPPKISATAANLELTGLINAFTATGALCIYDGSKPADADTAITTQSLLCVIFAPLSRWSVAGVVATLTPGAPNISTGDGCVGNGTTQTNAGTAAWFRMYFAYDTELMTGTAAWDGNVGAVGSTSDLELNDLTLADGQTITLPSYKMAISQIT